MKLTPAAARAAEPGAILRDHEVNGLQLRVTRTRKSWYLYYRHEGAERRPKLGDFPEMSLSAARDTAKAIKLRLAAGQDISEQRAAAKKAATVRDLCAIYFERHALVNKAQSSIASDRRLIETHIIPGLGRLRVNDVSLSDIDTFLVNVRNRKYAKHLAGRGVAPGAANRCRALLRTMFNLAIRRYEMRDRARGNPVEGSTAFHLPKRRRYATPDELRRIAIEVRRLAETHPKHAAALITLLTTGARVGEVTRATVGQFAGDAIRLTEHKTFKHIGEKTIPLHPAARALVFSIVAENATANDLLFGRIDLRWCWERIRGAAGCPDLQMRDFRRTFASYAVGSGATLDQIGDLFGHTNTQTTRGYSWLLQDARRSVAERGAETILAVSGLAGPAAVAARPARLGGGFRVRRLAKRR